MSAQCSFQIFHRWAFLKSYGAVGVPISVVEIEVLKTGAVSGSGEDAF
jgi:hypothetical protein